jgi:hypothetical protein
MQFDRNYGNMPGFKDNWHTYADVKATVVLALCAVRYLEIALHALGLPSFKFRKYGKQADLSCIYKAFCGTI